MLIIGLFAIFRWKMARIAAKYNEHMHKKMKETLEGGDEFSFPKNTARARKAAHSRVCADYPS